MDELKLIKLNRVLFFKKIAMYCAKLGLERSQKIVNLYEEAFPKNGSRRNSKITSGEKIQIV